MNKTFRYSLLLSAGITLSAYALEDITVINTSTTTGTPSTSEGLTFDNSVQSATSFSTATADYVVSSLADKATVRRNGVNNNYSSVWYAGGNAGASFSGVHQTSYPDMLLTNNVFAGTDNTFSNSSDPSVLNGANIERIDFTWNSARVASSGLRFGVFDRGVAGVHDAFAIAAITAVDGAGNPTAYSNLLKVAGGWGASNAFGDQFYHLFRYNAGDDISLSTVNTETNTQGIAGILISTADLGLANGTAIYGYSLMSNDVTDPLDVANFPTTTDGTTGGGGIDLAAINGLEIQAIPEPSTVFSLAIGLTVLGYVLRRKQVQLS